METLKRLIEIVVDMADGRETDEVHWERWERFQDGWHSMHDSEAEDDDELELSYGELRLADRF